MKLILFFTVLLFLLPLHAQKYAFVKYSTEQGLPQSQVTAITQDKAGYLWVGTLGGLARFNGREFKTFSSNDGLINIRITTLDFFENKLWVGHDGGISWFDNDRITSVPFEGTDKSRNVSKIILFKNELFVCSNGGGLFRLEQKRLKKISLKEPDHERIRDAIVHQDTLFLATRQGVLFSIDGKNYHTYTTLPILSYSAISGNHEYLYFVTFSDGIYQRNVRTNTLEFIPGETVGVPLLGAEIDRQNQLWLNTRYGILRLSADKELMILDESNGLPVNMISCLYEDRNGNIWIGSQGKGLFRFPGSVFTYYDHLSGFPSDLFLCGFENRQGDYYFGTYDKGIVRKRKGSVETIPSPESTIWCAQENVDGKDWFGGLSSLISIDSKGKQQVYTIDDGLPGIKITTLKKIDSYSMYVGGSEGVALYDGKSFIRIGGEASRFIGTVRDFELIKDSLFCATNLGVFVLRNSEFVSLSKTQQVVYNLEQDEHGNLYYGTEEGLFVYQNGKTKRIPLIEDAASNLVNFLNYKNGELFIGTNNGLFVLKPNSKNKNLRRYGGGDGLIDLETNLNSSFFDKKGQFWFGTASGLVCFHFKGAQTNFSPPLLSLKKILLNYQPFDYSSYSNELLPSGLPSSLKLPHNKNNLIFELDGVALVQHRGLKYQFLLEGMHSKWSPLTEVATITFTSIPAGDYTLRMRAVDLDGRVSDEIQFPFSIGRPYYATWWFITLVIIVLGLMIFALFRFRVRRITERNDKEKLVYRSRLLSLEQKSVNASMNRHFIFNALNSIQYFINTQDRLSANKYLTNFAQLIRKNLDSANSDSDFGLLSEELSRLKLYLSLEAMRFPDRFDYQIEVNDVDPEEIKVPFMIIQPFVENAIIHGILPMENKKGQILIHIYVKDEVLIIQIKDNGIGIHQSLSNKQLFDGDHRSQGTEIIHKRIELLRKVTGQKLELIGPNELRDDNGLINGTQVLIKIPLNYLENM